MKLLDCTLRDGGYINNWLFAPEVVNAIYKASNDAGIEYVEIGYIGKVNPFFINKEESKIMVMMDYNKREVLQDCHLSNIDCVRIATHKSDLFNAITFSEKLQEKGYFTGIQMMGISNYTTEELMKISKSVDCLDFLTLADSNGSLFPHQVENIINIFKTTKPKIGFHSHNNLQLSFANSVIATNAGADIIDCTFQGIGRGAGNLPTELFIAYLNKHYKQQYELKPVLEAIEKYISPLKSSYVWGYNIPNMLTGLEGIHPYYGRDAGKQCLTSALDTIEKIGEKKPMIYNGQRKIVCVIPARYKSSRFPGKPLEMINGKMLLQRVYENACNVDLFNHVLVATDDVKIAEQCKKLNMQYLMTSTSCKTGTDRLEEVSKRIDADIYVNLQGDECLILPEEITEFVKEIIEYGELDRIAFNGMTDCDEADLHNINVPKVVTNIYGDLLYMSRLPIPYNKSSYTPRYFKELGIHAYTKKGLSLFSSSEQSEVEKTEQLEFLRFLESGKPVRMIYVKMPFKNHAIDIPTDIKVVEHILKEQKIE